MAAERDSKPPRALLDANLLIALFLRPEHPLLAAAAAGRCRAFVCPYVAGEARRMVSRAFRGRRDEFEDFLASLPAEAILDAPAEAVARWRDYLSDRADVPVLAAAIEAGLDAIVTSDRTF